MKKRKIIAVLLGTGLLAACAKESAVFYSTSYPVVRIGAQVTATPIVIPPSEQGGEPTEEENPVVAIVMAAVIAEAPVKAGGGYMLDFTQYNGGPLRVKTTDEAEDVAGIFEKTPGADSLRFVYAEQNYICKVATYLDEQQQNKAVLTVDLTAQYQQFYPDNKITQVLRMEYTSVGAK